MVSLNVLSEAERHQLLVEWNDTKADYPGEATIHQLFEAQVERTPDQTAVVFEEQMLTYAQLNAQGNQLAYYLIEQGVKAESLVGICVERSLEMMVGLLAILKAGGAYVPIDPTYPQERIDYMLADSGARWVLTQTAVLSQLPEGDYDALAIDTLDVSAYGVSNPGVLMGPDHLAYVIYTSGSTGQPKGVLVTHQNVARLFSSTQTYFSFSSEDVWTLFHSYAFDFAVWEMWGALLHGGSLVVVPYWVSRSPVEFLTLLSQARVTVLNQTPSAFRQLLQEEAQQQSPQSLNLRLVIFGGEALELSSLRPWFERHGDEVPQLVNMYGITETTVHVTYQPLRMAVLEGNGVIGRPLPDLQMYILDQRQQPVPIGVRGEMYIGGAGVTGGYLNRSELSAERFIINPFREDGSLLYKSGDLARYLPDGNIEYLGRMDDQVKIRGFRIELGEIEQHLLALHDIKEVVVLAKETER
ncbi:MAG: amino acid adenylation domain-containing protein, partial [Trichodesmium sp. St18_bin1]|nr:amino acid adenylation domain-containing protein [Trichodesmium sp. St18_bin1]